MKVTVPANPANQRDPFQKVQHEGRSDSTSFFPAKHHLLESQDLTTWSAVWSRPAEAAGGSAPFDAAVIDESRDLSLAELRFLAPLASGGASLFFAGDSGQRIFRQPSSWRNLGTDVAR